MGNEHLRQLRERRRDDEDENVLPAISRSWREHRKRPADIPPQIEETSLTEESVGKSSHAFAAPCDTSSDVLMGNSGIPNLSPLKRKPTASRSAGGRPPKRQASGNRQDARGSISSVPSLTDRVQRPPSLSMRQTSPELGQSSSLLATPSLRQTENDEDESSVGHSLTWQPFPEPTRSPTPPASTLNFRPGDEEVVDTPAGHPPAQLPSACVQPGPLRIQFRRVVRVLNPKWTVDSQSDGVSCDLADELTQVQIDDAEAWFNYLQAKNSAEFRRWFDAGSSAELMCMAMKIISRNNSNWPTDPALRACPACIRRKNPCFLLQAAGTEVLILPQQSVDPFGYWGIVPPPPAPKSTSTSKKKKSKR